MATFAPVSTSIDRERSPCAFNLDPLSSEDEESILRTEDFLNDKLQSQADFSNYDTLITSVENQRAQLHSQVITFEVVNNVSVCADENARS